MRQSYSTITPSVVRAVARDALRSVLPWKGYGRRITAETLLDLLLLVASLASSLSALVRRFRFGFSHETARLAVHACLPGLPALRRGLVHSLQRFLPRRLLRRRRWVVALDTHRVPFYGDRSTPGVRGGQKKQGTKYAYEYATAVLVHRRHRYTVGLLALDRPYKPHEIVTGLLRQVAAAGLRLRGVVLDSGFDSGDTLLLLQRRRLSYAVPLRKKGSGQNRRNAAWDLEDGAVTTIQWKTERGNRPVRTQAVVVRRPREKDKKVYAFGGWGAGATRSAARRAALARRWYRSRFGIETSYRQMNQGKGRTTSKDAAYRLLLLGLALLLRQAWAWLSARVARARGLLPSAWVGELGVERVLDWLAHSLRQKYKEQREIRLESPILSLEPAKP